MVVRQTNFLVKQDVLSQFIQEKTHLKEHLTPKEIESFSRHLSVEEIPAGSPLMRKGEPADSLVMILNGSCQVIDGDQQLAILQTGEFVGESMFSEEPTRIADVEAVSQLKAARFTLNDFRNFLDSDQTAALTVREYFRLIKRDRDERNSASSFKEKRQFLALIAHNNMKAGLVDFCEHHKEKIQKFPLIATGTTGSLLYQTTGLRLSQKVASGPLGGDQAVGTLISTNNICGVIFFRDPLSAHPHHADIEALGRLCDVYQVPFATNPRSGEAILDYLLSDKSRHKVIANRALEQYNKGQKQVLG